MTSMFDSDEDWGSFDEDEPAAPSASASTSTTTTSDAPLDRAERRRRIVCRQCLKYMRLADRPLALRCSRCRRHFHRACATASAVPAAPIAADAAFVCHKCAPPQEVYSQWSRVVELIEQREAPVALSRLGRWPMNPSSLALQNIDVDECESDIDVMEVWPSMSESDRALYRSQYSDNEPSVQPIDQPIEAPRSARVPVCLQQTSSNDCEVLNPLSSACSQEEFLMHRRELQLLLREIWPQVQCSAGIPDPEFRPLDEFTENALIAVLSDFLEQLLAAAVQAPAQLASCQTSMSRTELDPAAIMQMARLKPRVAVPYRLHEIGVFSSPAKHRRTEHQSQSADASNVDDESSSGSDEPESDSDDVSPTADGPISQKRKRSKLKVQSWPSILAAAIMIDTPTELVDQVTQQMLKLPNSSNE